MNNTTANKSFFHSVNENIPLTAFKWKNNDDFLIGDTEGNIYEYHYDKDTNAVKKIH